MSDLSNESDRRLQELQLLWLKQIAKKQEFADIYYKIILGLIAASTIGGLLLLLTKVN